MLRPGMLLALSLTGTFVDALLRTDFAIRKHPSYTVAWPLLWLDFHQLDNACLWARQIQKPPGQLVLTVQSNCKASIRGILAVGFPFITLVSSICSDFLA